MNDETRQAVASLLKSGDHEAVAQLIVEYVQPGHITQDLLGLFLTTRRLNPGDALVKKVRKGIKVRTLVPGTTHLADEITVANTVAYKLDGANIKVTANEWELESGELGTVDEIRQEMLAKLRDFYTSKIFAALSSVWNATNTPNNFTAVGGPLTATALKNAIDRINQTTGGVKAVVGSRAALTPVTTFGAGWSDGTNAFPANENIREIMRTGWLGVYYGAPIIAIEQVYDNPVDYNPLVPTDKVVVIGKNVGEFVLYGDVRWKQYVDMQPTPPQWYLELYQQFGLVIDNADGIYVLQVA